MSEAPPVDLQQLSLLQDEVGSWSVEQFGDQPDLYPLLGVGEEYGELIHSVLKQAQGIRSDDDGVGDDATRDAVGDIVIYLADFSARHGIDLGKAVHEAWYGEVKAREWDSSLVDDVDALEGGSYDYDVDSDDDLFTKGTEENPWTNDDVVDEAE